MKQPTREPTRDQVKSRIHARLKKIQAIQEKIQKDQVALAQSIPDDERDVCDARPYMLPPQRIIMFRHDACGAGVPIEDPGVQKALSEGQDIKAECPKCGKPLLIRKGVLITTGPVAAPAPKVIG